MRIAVFSSKSYDQQFLEQANEGFDYHLSFLEARLTPETASLASGYDAICVFVNDRLDASVLEQIAVGGTRIIALRCAGFNNVDVPAAERLGLKVVRVPAYSPYSVAEHTVGLILTLNRKIHRAYNRVREGNFALSGLLGFDLHGRTVGLVGTGKIGAIFAGIMRGFGCRLLGFDPYPNPDCEALGMTYVSLEELLAQSDIISLHCPLTPQTRHIINHNTIRQMKDGVMLVNTSRGAAIRTADVIAALKSGKIGALALDVYEEEADYFFENRSERVIADDDLARLLTFPNVLITGHQAFFTRDALESIAATTLGNIRDLETAGHSPNEVVTKPAT